MSMTFNGTSGITFPDGTTQNTASASIGVGQSWVDVTSSRTAGTTYTNSTGKPIMVIVSCNGASGNVGLTVGGLALPTQTVGGSVGFNLITTAIIPNSTTYSLSSFAGGIIKWVELR